LAMATRGSICPARPKSDFLTSLIFRVFQQYRRKVEIQTKMLPKIIIRPGHCQTQK
jgi:hypothetical protein